MTRANGTKNKTLGLGNADARHSIRAIRGNRQSRSGPYVPDRAGTRGSRLASERHGIHLRPDADRDRAPARYLCGGGLRPRAPRLDPAREPAGVLFPLPRAQRDRRQHSPHQSRLPPRRGGLSARPQRGRAGRGVAASRERCDEGGRRAGQAAACGGCPCDAFPAAATFHAAAARGRAEPGDANARCSTRPAPPADPRAACSPTSTH